MWPHITDKRGTAFFLLCLQKRKKKDRSKEKRILDDVERISIYIRKKESSAVMILNHFVSFHITPDLLIYIKSDAAASGGFFFVPLVQAGILQSSNYLCYLTYLIFLLHRPKGSLAEFPKKTRHVNSGRFYAWCKHGRYWGGMSIADKKSTHHHHHYHQSVAGHDHHHQTVLSSERERGPDDSDEEGYGRLLTFPFHFDHNSLPKVPGSWQIGRLATGRIYLVAARHGKGRGEGREGGSRKGGSRKGGEESGSGLCSLSGIYCFLFSVFLFGLLTFFGGPGTFHRPHPFHHLPE